MNAENDTQMVKLDHEKALAYCGGSEDFLKEIMSMYVSEDKREPIKSAYDSRSWDTYRTLVHNVKSNSRTIGAMELGDKAQELENAVKEGDMIRIGELHEKVLNMYGAVLKHCEKYIYSA